jgi:hypothetical protein
MFGLEEYPILSLLGAVVLAKFLISTAWSAAVAVYAFFLHRVNLKAKYGPYAGNSR